MLFHGHGLGDVHDLPGRRLDAFGGQLRAERGFVADQEWGYAGLTLGGQGAAHGLRRGVVAAHRIERDPGSHEMQRATSAYMSRFRTAWA